MKTLETFYPAAEAKLETLGLGPFSQKAWKLLFDAMTAANAKRAARTGEAPKDVLNVPIWWLLIWLVLRMLLAKALFEAAHPSQVMKAFGGVDGLHLGLNTDQRSWGVVTQARTELMALISGLDGLMGSLAAEPWLNSNYFRTPWEMREEIGEFRAIMAHGAKAAWTKGTALALSQASAQSGLPSVQSLSSFVEITSAEVSQSANIARHYAGNNLGLHPWHQPSKNVVLKENLDLLVAMSAPAANFNVSSVDSKYHGHVGVYFNALRQTMNAMLTGSTLRRLVLEFGGAQEVLSELANDNAVTTAQCDEFGRALALWYATMMSEAAVTKFGAAQADQFASGNFRIICRFFSEANLHLESSYGIDLSPPLTAAASLAALRYRTAFGRFILAVRQGVNAVAADLAPSISKVLLSGIKFAVVPHALSRQTKLPWSPSPGEVKLMPVTKSQWLSLLPALPQGVAPPEYIGLDLYGYGYPVFAICSGLQRGAEAYADAYGEQAAADLSFVVPEVSAPLLRWRGWKYWSNPQTWKGPDYDWIAYFDEVGKPVLFELDSFRTAWWFGTAVGAISATGAMHYLSFGKVPDIVVSCFNANKQQQEGSPHAKLGWMTGKWPYRANYSHTPCWQDLSTVSAKHIGQLTPSQQKALLDNAVFLDGATMLDPAAPANAKTLADIQTRKLGLPLVAMYNSLAAFDLALGIEKNDHTPALTGMSGDDWATELSALATASWWQEFSSIAAAKLDEAWIKEAEPPDIVAMWVAFRKSKLQG